MTWSVCHCSTSRGREWEFCSGADERRRDGPLQQCRSRGYRITSRVLGAGLKEAEAADITFPVIEPRLSGRHRATSSLARAAPASGFGALPYRVGYRRSLYRIG